MSKEIKLTRQMLLDCLQEEWGQYIAAYQRLSSDEQHAFLERQGYPSLHDLLAHICAWWEEGLQIVTSILDNAELPKREYDVDAFNVEAIRRFETWTQDDLLAHYENLREAWLDLVAELPENAYDNRRIAGWMHAVVTEHAEEHKIG